MTRVVRVGADPLDDPAVLEAADMLRAGELVAFPTETVYGLGADATSPGAVDRIFVAKDRPGDNPVIVHVATTDMLDAHVAVPDRSLLAILARRFWPGPLTLVLPAKETLRRSVCRGLTTAAVRIPGHPVALALLTRAAIPIAAPSANLSGRPSPTCAEHVRVDLDGRIPLILDGGLCSLGIESTVLDLSDGPPRILRPGSVTREQLTAVVGEVVLSTHDDAAPRSPGTRYRHYSPSSPLVVLESDVDDKAVATLLALLADSGARIGYLGDRDVARAHSSVAHRVRRDADAERRAHHLYDDLRRLDRPDVDIIVADGIADDGLGASVMERLRRAATLLGDRDRVHTPEWRDQLWRLTPKN